MLNYAHIYLALQVQTFADSVPCYCSQIPKLLASCCPGAA